MKHLPSRNSFGCPSAFTLVEVTLAIGIIGFAFVAVLGLLPAGLTAFRKAMDVSVSSQIVQRIVTEAQQTDFNKLISSTDAVQVYPSRFFDEEGNEVDQATSVYEAKLIVHKDPVVPGASPEQKNLVRLIIDVASNPGHQPIARDEETAGFKITAGSAVPVLRYAAYLAENQIAR